MAKEDFKKVIRLIREEKVALFIGSGFSLEAGAPSVKDLCKSILQRIELADNDKKEKLKKLPLDELSEYFVEEECGGSRNELISLLQEKFSFERKSMVDHEMLAKIPHLKRIFTTNYDTLLEDSYPPKKTLVVRDNKQCAYENDFPYIIYKVHGDFYDPDSIVITKKDYEHFFDIKRSPLLVDKIRSEFTSKHILFIGYSLQDSNIIKIIKFIKRCIGNNQKQMFLLAPNFRPEQKRQLQKLGVTYYDAIAHDFLVELTEQLALNISDDYRRRKVSEGPYQEYMLAHDLKYTVKKEEYENNIIKVESISGAPIKRESLLVVNPDAAKILQSKDFNKHGVILRNLPFPALSNAPAISFDRKEIRDFVFRMNGINFAPSLDDIKRLHIVPEPQAIDLTIRIPSREFRKKQKCRAFSLNSSTIQIDMDCEAFDAEIRINFLAVGGRINFSFKGKPTYRDNDAALQWSDFLCAISAGEDVYIKELSEQPFNASVMDDNKPFPYEQVKAFYENIKQIELTGKNFKIYENYSDERYNASCLIRALLNGGYVKETIPCNPFLIPPSAAPTDLREGETFELVTMKQNKVLTLNREEFIIPYLYEKYPMRVIKVYDDEKKLLVRSYDGRRFLQPSKKPTEELFPGYKNFVHK